ncbi:hypothetical protein D9M68_882660 [compost metagenome]
MQDGVQRGQLGRVDAQGAVARRTGDVYAAALPGLYHAVLAQPGDGFADHGAADAELLCQRDFGRQLRAGQHAAFIDFGAQPFGNGIGQRGRGGKSGKRHG